MEDGRIHSQLRTDSRASRSYVYLPVRRLGHDHFDPASPAPGGALWRHLSDRGRNGDADAFDRRFTLNPVLVVFSFVFWFWLWGVPGAILSTPILATTKIVCDRIRLLAALGHILAG
jgi:hypothetical protein